MKIAVWRKYPLLFITCFIAIIGYFSYSMFLSYAAGIWHDRNLGERETLEGTNTNEIAINSSAEVKQIILEKIKAGEKDEAARLILEILNEKTCDPVTVEGWCGYLQWLEYTQEAMDYLEGYISESKRDISDQDYYLLRKREALILRQIA